MWGMLHRHQQERLEWAGWELRERNYNGWSNKLSYCHHTHPSFYSVSVCLPHCLHTHTAWHWHTHTDTHLPASPCPERAARARLSSALTSHRHSQPRFFNSLTPRASRWNIKERGTRQILNHIKAIHTGRLCHTRRHMNTHADYRGVCFSPPNICGTCWDSRVTVAQWGVCVCVCVCVCVMKVPLTCWPKTSLPVRVAWRTTSRSSRTLYPSNICSSEGKRKKMEKETPTEERKKVSRYASLPASSLSSYTRQWTKLPTCLFPHVVFFAKQKKKNIIFHSQKP